MANISSFFGEITLPIECAKEWKEFADNYVAPFYGVMDFESLDRSVIVKNTQSNQESLIVRFFGAGRWSALDLFARDGIAFFYPEENPAALPLIQKLSNQELPISYIDSEPGCKLLYEFTGDLCIDESGNVCMLGDSEYFDYTSKNLIMLECDHCAINGDIKEDFEELVSIVTQHLDIANTPMLRSLIRNKLDDYPYDGMLTEEDLDYSFLEDIRFDLTDMTKKQVTPIISQHALVNFL